jgi:hypothetical protein
MSKKVLLQTLSTTLVVLVVDIHTVRIHVWNVSL